MSNIAVWKYLDETQYMLKEVQTELNAVKENLAIGTPLGLTTNEAIVREYCINIGRIEGLMFLESLLTKEETEDDRSKDELHNE